MPQTFTWFLIALLSNFDSGGLGTQLCQHLMVKAWGFLNAISSPRGAWWGKAARVEELNVALSLCCRCAPSVERSDSLHTSVQTYCPLNIKTFKNSARTLEEDCALLFKNRSTCEHHWATMDGFSPLKKFSRRSWRRGSVANSPLLELRRDYQMPAIGPCRPRKRALSLPDAFSPWRWSNLFIFFS